MGVVICPSCGRFNFPEELAARGFTCDLCRGLIPVPEDCPKNEAITSEPLLRNPAVVPEHPLPGSGGYPVSKVCPNCGHAKFQRRYPERFLALTWDRVCRACNTRYTPPTPAWAPVAYFAVGLMSVCLGGVILVLSRGFGFKGAVVLGCVGIAAIVQGWRELGKPGKG
jgi:uncharacterized protein (DUF983 family)